MKSIGRRNFIRYAAMGTAGAGVTLLPGWLSARENRGDIRFKGLSPSNISDYGAIGDGKTVNTKAIQKAIDDCHESGGGKVLFSNGNYVTGTLFLKSNVFLHIEVGATLSGSTKISDYAPNVFRNQYADKNSKE